MTQPFPLDLDRLSLALKLPLATLSQTMVDAEVMKLEPYQRTLLYTAFSPNWAPNGSDIARVFGWSVKRALLERNTMLWDLRSHIATSSGHEPMAVPQATIPPE